MMKKTISNERIINWDIDPIMTLRKYPLQLIITRYT